MFNRDIVGFIFKGGGQILCLDFSQGVKGNLHLVDVSCPHLGHFSRVDFGLEIVSFPCVVYEGDNRVHVRGRCYDVFFSIVGLVPHSHIILGPIKEKRLPNAHLRSCQADFLERPNIGNTAIALTVCLVLLFAFQIAGVLLVVTFLLWEFLSSGTHVQAQRGNVLGPGAYISLFPEVGQDIVFAQPQFIQRFQQEAKIHFRVSQSPICRGIGTKEVLDLRVFPLGEAPCAS